MDGIGLSSDEARRRLAAHGPNALPEATPPAAWRRVLGQLRSPLIYILLAALAFDLGSWIFEGRHGVPFESLIIGLVLALNAGLGAFQEHRSERALARLRTLGAPRARVLRDGAWSQLPVAELVPGDRVRVEPGDRLPADGRIAEAHGLSIDESMLTGESLPVDHHNADEVAAGTVVARGVALVDVSRTGADSALGRLAHMIGEVAIGRTPLERRLDAFGRTVARAVCVLAVAIAIAGIAVEGVDRLAAVLLFAAALAVAAVPEGLPAVVTLTLAMGVQRMARRRALVRRLAAVEALGSVTVIATDKTGTLTENRLTVAGLDAADPDAALRALVLASDDAGSSDPVEVGILAHARQSVDVDALRRRHPRIAERPFDSAWKFARATVADEGGPVSYFKGAPEALIARAALSAAEQAAWLDRVARLAAGGQRVLAVACAAGEREDGLTLLGLVGLRDPPRAEVAAAIRAAQEAGIRVLMVTGDHPDTALAVAAEVGIAGAGAAALTGADLAGMDAAQLARAAATCSVFARVDPGQKLAIVDALERAGEVVAVTGDGVNDAPALKRASVGVAMGERGSDVAREVADLVLLDDNFATIVAAVEEGRGIHGNIQKFLRFLLSTNAAEVLLVVAGMIGAGILGLRDADGALLLPLTAAQLLWINFVTDGPPALALGVDRNPELLRARPRPSSAALLDRGSLAFVVASGAFKAAVAGGLLLGLPLAGWSLGATQAAVFLYTAVAQLAFAYPARRLGGPVVHNRWLHAAVIGGIAVQLAALLVPPLREGLGLAALDAAGLALVGAAAALTWGGAELINRVLPPTPAAAPPGVGSPVAVASARAAS